MPLLLRKILLRISGAYVCVIVACQLALFYVPTFEMVGHVEHGCFLGDALIPYAECKGFPGSSVVRFVLSLPYALMFIPMFGLYGVMQGGPIWPLVLGLALWAPVAYLFWHGLPSLVRRLRPASN